MRQSRGRCRSTIASTASPLGSVPYARPPIAAEAGGEERVRDLGRCVADEQRRLQRGRERFDEPARARLVRELGAARPRRASGGSGSSSPRNASSASGSRSSARSTSSAMHVARALPDRVERALAVEARQARLLDVAVAAETLERLGDERRRRLAHPVLRDGRGEAPERRVAPRRRRGRAAAPSAVAASDSRHRSASTFRISGWSTSRRPNAARCAAWCVASADRASHQRRRAEHAVEPRVRRPSR